MFSMQNIYKNMCGMEKKVYSNVIKATCQINKYLMVFIQTQGGKIIKCLLT